MDERQLFTGATQYYAKYRPGYPKEFFDYVRNYFKLDGTGRLLDLGCGTGQIAIPLARDFEEVIGLDPEEDMLKEAKHQAEKAGVKNIQWVLGKAEEKIKDLGMFRLTTIGAAFHWVDQKKVLDLLYEHTEKGGGVVIVYDSSGSVQWSEKELDGWRLVRREIIKKYLGQERRAGNTYYAEPEKEYEEYLSESPFGGYEEWRREYVRTFTLDEVIGFVYSTSFANQRILGNKREAFESELRAELLALHPDGVFTQEVVIQALVARKIN